MSLPPFDPKLASQYGSFGEETANKMHECLSHRGLGLSYDPSSRKFTILGSADTKIEEIERIFNQKKYVVWAPKVLEEVDAEGNHLVELEEADSLYSGRLAPVPGKEDHRDFWANQLVSGLRSIGVSFQNQECIDIGCRSGENALAMQDAGAKVIGIDPDDQEFGTALQKGMKRSQLVKATLQEYCEKFPNRQFDRATVFLWNIMHSERQSFVESLENIIKPNGLVIIGYADEPYDKDPIANVPDLMKKSFSRVEKFILENNINKYILICSNPIHRKPESCTIS